MDPQFIMLAVVVAAASVLQAATGIGFGVIAGPVMLIVLNSGSAIQISIVLSFIIAALLVPSLLRHIHRTLLLRFLVGSVIGLPLGLLVFLTVNIDLLKFLAGVAVLFTLGFVIRAGRVRSEGSSGSEEGTAGRVREGASSIGRMEQVSVGVASGVMSGILAMPGPIPAAWMSARGYGKDTVRATILTMFLISYFAAFALQAGLAGVETETLWQCLLLTPPTLLGVFVGRLLAARLTAHLFRRVLIVVLGATSLSLFVSSIPHLVT